MTILIKITLQIFLIILKREVQIRIKFQFNHVLNKHQQLYNQVFIHI